jgi:hypothetical protein
VRTGSKGARFQLATKTTKLPRARTGVAYRPRQAHTLFTRGCSNTTPGTMLFPRRLGCRRGHCLIPTIPDNPRPSKPKSRLASCGRPTPPPGLWLHMVCTVVHTWPRMGVPACLGHTQADGASKPRNATWGDKQTRNITPPTASTVAYRIPRHAHTHPMLDHLAPCPPQRNHLALEPQWPTNQPTHLHKTRHTQPRLPVKASHQVAQS